MPRGRRWGMRLREDTGDRERMDRREGMGHRVVIIMGGMHRVMDHRDSIWMIGGVGLVGLWRRCWRVWRVVVVWMLVYCFRCGF